MHVTTVGLDCAQHVFQVHGIDQSGPALGPLSKRIASWRRCFFADIVGSTAPAKELGNERWRSLPDAYHAAARREFTDFQEREVKSLGNGFLATFNGPAGNPLCIRPHGSGAIARHWSPGRSAHRGD
jgi:hypothetical protein